MSDITWTEPRIKTLKALWADGYSCSLIAAELGGEITRNAVIGKVNRLGLPRRKEGHSARLPASGGKRKKTPERPSPPPTHEITDQEIPIRQRRKLMQLTNKTCHWPVGDPDKPGFFFCGAKIRRNAYCVRHARLAYQPTIRHRQRQI